MTERIDANYDSITHLEGLEHPRKRPQLYLGSTQDDGYNSATFHTVKEILSNSVDEFLAGYGTKIEVTLDKDTNKVTIRDFGRGIPFGWNTDQNCSNLHLAVGVLNSGGKYNKDQDDSAFIYSLGLNGVGCKVVNAVSSEFEVTAYRDGSSLSAKYHKGVCDKDVNNKDLWLSMDTRAPNGTKISWIIDKEVLAYDKHDEEHFKRLLKETAYLNSGLELDLEIKSQGNSEKIKYLFNSLNDYKKDVLGSQNVLIDFPVIKIKDEDNNRIELSMSVAESEISKTYVNGGLVQEDSTPSQYVKQAYQKSLKEFIENHSNLSKSDKKVQIQTTDINSGLVFILKILHKDAQYDSQNKVRCLNKIECIKQKLPEVLLDFFIKHPNETLKVVEQVLLSATARIAAEEARKKTLEVKKITKQKKVVIDYDYYTPSLKTLQDCKTEDEVNKSMLFLVEGASPMAGLIPGLELTDNSTGNSFKEFKGALAMKGMTASSLNIPIENLLMVPEIARIILAMGLDINNPENIDNLNYDKLVFAGDADAYGVGFSYLYYSNVINSHFPALFKKGKTFRLSTPLFEVYNKTTNKYDYIYDDEDKETRLRELGYKPEEVNKTYTIQRSKGLGSMSKEQLRMVMENPRLIPISKPCTDEEYSKFMRMMFSMVGDSRDEFVLERKKYLYENSLEEDHSFEDILLQQVETF